jgi:coenzyme F420-0:L-glutamate ligase/coenzyme F420-1:gamma-L-glutamate ligase
LLIVYPVKGIPEVRQGDDIVSLLLEALKKNDLQLRDLDIVVIKQKIVSKSEGRLVRLDSVTPGRRARRIAAAAHKDPNMVEMILRESKRVVRMGHGVIITETTQGLVCANSGVDRSNVPPGWASLLPERPDRSATRLRRTLEATTGLRHAVIITDTFGRPWRKGQTDVAIGCSGISPLNSYRGKLDLYGYKLRVTEPAIIDEIAGTAELVSGKLTGVPVAIVRGLKYQRSDSGVKALLMERRRDLFR